MSSTVIYIPYSLNKIKSIPRRPSRHIQTLQDLKMLIKKGLKVKHLKLAWRDERTESLQVPLVKRLTKYWNCLHSLQVSGICTKDIIPLLKLQYRMRDIKGLQLGTINPTKAGVSEGLKKLLVRFKHLREYKSESEEDSDTDLIYELLMDHRHTDFFNALNNFRSEKRFPFKFHSKKSLPYKNSQKTRKIMLCMRKHLPSLASIEENQSSLRLTLNISFDLKTEEFDRKILDSIRKLKRICFLDKVTLPGGLGYGMHKILPVFEANGLNMISQLHLNNILNESASFERFLSRKDARIILDSSSNYSWESLLSMLNFSQEMLSIHGSFIDFKDFTFDFRAPTEVKIALIDHFKQKERRWERLIFSFKGDWFDLLQEDKRSCIEEMVNEVCKEENQNKYSEIQWNVSFPTKFEEELGRNEKDKIFSVIQDLIQRQQEAKILTRYVLKINFERENEKELLLFLDLFEQIPNCMNMLELNLFPEQTKRMKQAIYAPNSPKFSDFDRYMDCMQIVRQIALQVDNIKSYVIQLKGNNFFKEFFIPQLNEIYKLGCSHEI